MKQHSKYFLSLTLLLLGFAAFTLVSCGGEDPAPTPTTPTQSVTLTSGTSSTYTVDATATALSGNISFSSTGTWTATVEAVSPTSSVDTGVSLLASGVDWVTLSAYSGNAGNQSIRVTLKANESTSSRAARIRIAGQNNTVLITITQKGAEGPSTPTESIVLDNGVATSYTISADDTSIGSAISFTATSTWRVSRNTLSGTEANQWVTVSPTTGGTGNKSVTITLAKNEDTTPRSARVDIIGTNNTVSITINQEAAEAAPEPDPERGETKTYTVNGVSFKMVGVVGGTFTMGAGSEQGTDYKADERPTHSVTLSDYSIGETEVTQALWVAVMGNNPSEYYQYGDQLPVETVSYNDCITFINKLNELTGKQFRLPTEAEWEFAARGGKNASTQYKYAGSNTIANVAWYYETTRNNNYRPHPVKTKAANILGLYDMSGNVWEWCQDFYDAYSSSAQNNPTGPSEGTWRVIRGGGWTSNADGCRVSLRYYGIMSNPGVTPGLYGLRLAL